MKLAAAAVDDYVNIFGVDRFRLELQDHGINDQFQLNIRMMKLAERTGIPLVFTNDCHFIGKEDFAPHKAFKCIQGGDNVNTAFHVYRPDHRIKSVDEMHAIVAPYPEEYHERMHAAMDHTVDIAEMVDFNFGTGKDYYFPKVETQADSIRDEFVQQCLEGFGKRSPGFIPNRGMEYAERLMYEMSLISRMGFESYFLIVSDLIRWAKKQGMIVTGKPSRHC